MKTKQKRIQELEQELQKKLDDYACSYQVFVYTTSGEKKLNGKHIGITFPRKVSVKISEIVSLFEEYYGDIKKVGKVKTFGNGFGKTFQSITLNLEGGY